MALIYNGIKTSSSKRQVLHEWFWKWQHKVNNVLNLSSHQKQNHGLLKSQPRSVKTRFIWNQNPGLIIYFKKEWSHYFLSLWRRINIESSPFWALREITAKNLIFQKNEFFWNIKEYNTIYPCRILGNNCIYISICWGERELRSYCFLTKFQ